MSEAPPPPKKTARKRRPRKSKRDSSAPAPSEASSKRSARLVNKGIAFWTLVATIAIALLTAFAMLLVYPSTRGPGGGRDVALDVPGDESADALAARLAAAGLVKSPRLFAAYLKFTGAAPRVVKGAHLLTDDASPRELVARLERSEYAAHARVTFPEGWTRFDFARRLQERHVCASRAFLDATADRDVLRDLNLSDAPDAEGFLFPATYDFALDSDARDVVRRMKIEFDKRWSLAAEKHGSQLLDVESSLHWGMREIVTLASIVEKEAAVDDERAVISSVFVNRMRDPGFTPKLLQSDPTAGYGCAAMGGAIPTCASFTGKITHDLLQDASNPYNTYKHEGLPPGPIANPGTKSLAAAMAPAVTRYLYFVARGPTEPGRHAFSVTYGDHTSAIRAASAPKP